ncbi:hypothetical protein GCM10009416_40260 [Craurococcus roseus]|uniref:Uncharacterized protein n=1 Tax=Craurococcus roseus TaxID=77585 RepID=A0ABN1FUG7_9PROT
MARSGPLGLYLGGCARVRGTGAGTAETSFYPVVSEALNAVGSALRPKVFPLLRRARRPPCRAARRRYARARRHLRRA